MERTITVTSKPKPAKKPAHSNATYDAPTTSVFPGGYSRENKSSLVMAYSLTPVQSVGYRGLSPVATINLSAVKNDSFPFLSTSYQSKKQIKYPANINKYPHTLTLCWSTNDP